MARRRSLQRCPGNGAWGIASHFAPADDFAPGAARAVGGTGALCRAHRAELHQLHRGRSSAPWQPACMTADELAAWQAANGRNAGVTAWPCVDCPASWAAQQRRLGRCNGAPGVEPEVYALSVTHRQPAAAARMLRRLGLHQRSGPALDGERDRPADLKRHYAAG